MLGASGFIGRWVTAALARGDTRVTAAVRDAATARDVLARWGVDADLVTVDLEQPGAAAALVARVRPTHVFNLAAYGVTRAERDEARAQRLNQDLVAELAGACAPAAHWTGATLVHTGSAAEYGSAGGILREEGAAMPTTLYGRTKLGGTLALSSVARSRGTRAVTARLFTVIGDGEDEGRLFPSLLRAAASSTPIDLSDGQAARDVAFAGDVAAALVALGDSAFVPGAIVNVASGELHTVEALARAVARALAMPADHLRFGVRPAYADEMVHDGVSVEHMVSLLGGALPADLADVAARAVQDATARRAART